MFVVSLSPFVSLHSHLSGSLPSLCKSTKWKISVVQTAWVSPSALAIFGYMYRCNSDRGAGGGGIEMRGSHIAHLITLTQLCQSQQSMATTARQMERRFSGKSCCYVVGAEQNINTTPRCLVFYISPIDGERNQL